MESQLQEVGRTIHAALPGRSRHPLQVIDQRAMELASQDAELRAALFRFVDVTPACRSLDDLARHLTGYLEEVDDRPPPIEAAMKMSGTKPGRAALGAAAAAGVRHMAHRFIVGESPKAALKTIRHLWDNGAAVSLDLLGEATVTAGRGGPLRGAVHGRARDARRARRRRGRSARCSRPTRSAGSRG